MENQYPYSIKKIVNRVPPYAALNTYDMDSVHAISLFKCMFKTAFQSTTVQSGNREFIKKRNSKLNNCFQQFVKYVTVTIAKAHPQWTRRQLLDEVNETVVAIMDEFVENVQRFALLYDGDEADDPNVVYAPMYQTAHALNRLVTSYNFLRHSKQWLQQRETRRVRAGIRSLRKSVRQPLSQVFSDPFLSSHISNMALSKPLSLQQERKLDSELDERMKKHGL